MIGERLKEIRKDRGDTQSDLAQKLNVSLSTVKSWEGGHSEPCHSMLVTICQIYHVSSDFLLGLSDVDPLFLEMAKEQFSAEDLEDVQFFEEFLLFKREKRAKRRKNKL